MFRDEWGKTLAILFSFCFLFILIFQDDALARVGGGRSSGSRGSRPSAPPRSYSTPKPAQPPTGAKENASQQASPQPQQPGSSFLRGLGGGILGGILGGMLFRGLGFGSDFGGSGSGIGFLEIVLICALIYGAYYFFIKRRRREALAGGYYQQSVGTGEPSYQTSHAPVYVQPREDVEDSEKGLGHIRQMDASFDEKKFQDLCMDHFFKIQGAWTNRDISGVRNLLTDEMFKIIGDDVYKLKLDKKINKLDNIAVRSVDIVEAWQESGTDFISVKFNANLLDYTIDEPTGQVVSGSRTEPVKFEEYWTFSRPVGNHPWQLSAIQQVE